MRKLSIIILSVSLLVLGGCLDYEENLVINSDGSGTIEMHYAISRIYLDNMANMAQQMGQDPAEMEAASEMFHKDEIVTALAATGADIKMDSFEKVDDEKSRHYRMKFSFSDIDQLYLLLMSIFPEDEEDVGRPITAEDDSLPSLYVAQDDGTWLFERSFDDMQEEEMGGEYSGDESYSDEEWQSEDNDYDADDESDDESESEAPTAEQMEEAMEELGSQMQAMADLNAEHFIRFTVKFPGEIVESNATKVEGSTATWEFKLEQMSGKLESFRAVVKP